MFDFSFNYMQMITFYFVPFIASMAYQVYSYKNLNRCYAHLPMIAVVVLLAMIAINHFTGIFSFIIGGFISLILFISGICILAGSILGYHIVYFIHLMTNS